MVPLTIANLKMMVRNRHTTFWALFFPLLLVIVFGIFDFDASNSSSLAIIDEANNPSSNLLREKLTNISVLKIDDQVNNPNEARQMIKENKLDYLIVIHQAFGETSVQPETTPVSLMYDTGNQEQTQLIEGVLSNLISQVTTNNPASQPGTIITSEGITTPQVSYFDLVLMGLVGLGVMTNSIISIAVKISNYRNQSILRRMLITPLPIWKYFASEITAHVALALVQAAIILAIGVFIFGGSIHGNIIWIFIVVLLGSLVFLNIGFIVSAWANSPSAASGMGNAVALPMLFLAGTFFSTASLPWILPNLVQALPLTPMITAMREVALDSATLWDIWPQLATLGGWVAVTALGAIKVFRFS